MPSAIFGRFDPICGRSDADEFCAVAVRIAVGIEEEFVGFAGARNGIGQGVEFGRELFQQIKLFIGLAGGSDNGDGTERGIAQDFGNLAQVPSTTRRPDFEL